MESFRELLGKDRADWTLLLALLVVGLVVIVLVHRVFAALTRRIARGGLAGRFIRALRWPLALIITVSLASWVFRHFLGASADDNFTKGFDVAIAYSALMLAVRIGDVAAFDYFFERVQGVRVPSLLRDPIRYLLYLIALLVVLKAYYGKAVDLTGILTFSAAASFVLGFALQDTLGNFFSGLSIYFERSIHIGDWIAIGDKEGEVLETTWRAVKMRTLRGDYVVVPNSVISKAELVNFSQPTSLHARNILVGIDYSAPPGRVLELLSKAAAEAPGVLAEPPVRVRMIGFGDSAINYEIKAWMQGYETYKDVDSAVMRHVWYHLKRAGIGIPFPMRTVQLERARPGHREREIDAAAERLAQVDFLAALSPDERKRLAERLSLEFYTNGESIVRQGESGDSFYVVWSGRAAVRLGDASSSGGTKTVATLGPGEFFGEMSLLTGAPRGASVVADGDLVVAKIDRDAFHAILASNPQAMEQISRIVGERMLRNKSFVEELEREAASRSGSSDRVGDAAQWILSRVRKFFRISAA